MKSLHSLICSIAVLAGSCFSNSVSAQSSATSQVSATIVTPMTVEKLADLEFSNVSVNQAPAAKAGKVSRAMRRQAEGSATAVTAATFKLSGAADYAYGVTMPATVTKAVGDYTVTIGTLLSSNYALNAGGTDALSIRGTITVSKEPMLATNEPAPGDEEEGFGEFPVMIVYN